MNYKNQRTKTLIKNKVLELITLKKVHDPRIPVILSITSITLSKDLHYAHIYFTVFGNEADNKNAEEGLNSASGFIQKLLAKELALRYTPVIEFRYDKKQEKANEVDKLLDSLQKEDNKSTTKDTNKE